MSAKPNHRKRTATYVAAGGVLLLIAVLTGCSGSSPVPVAAPVPVTVTATKTAAPVTETVTKTVTKTAPPVTKTKTVTETVTPIACAAALDDAEAIMRKNSDANGSFIKAIQLMTAFDFTTATGKIEDGTASIKEATALVSKYAAHRDACLSLSS